MQRVVIPGGRSAEEIFATLLGLAGHRTLVVGLGNIGGLGLEMVQLFDSRGVPVGNDRSSPVCVPEARQTESDSWNC